MPVGTTFLLQLFCRSSFLNHKDAVILILTKQTIQSAALCINLSVEIMRKGWDESIQSDDGYVGVGIVFMTQSVSVKNVENS